MESKITVFQTLCACELTYHIRKYKRTGEIKVSLTELHKILDAAKSRVLQQELWEGKYEDRCLIDDAAGCWVCKTATDEILIAYRGTIPFVFDLSTHRSRSRTFEAIKDGFRNIFVKLEEGEAIVKKYGQGSQVHQGFDMEVDAMWDFMLKTVQEFDPEGKMPITLTGHSQGAGVAFLTALRLCVEAKNSENSYHQKIGARIAQIITFGAPQAGDWGFALNYRKHYYFGEGADQKSVCLDEITYRYDNAGDCISIVPNKATDLAKLFKNKFSFLPISMSFVETWVSSSKGLLEKYVEVGQHRYINYNTHQIETDRSYELRLADMYLAWTEKGNSDIFAYHLLFTDEGYIKMNRPPQERT